jgi:hypothetical protein
LQQSPLECSTSFSEDSLEEIILGRATFSPITHYYHEDEYEDVSFSVFGTDRKINEIYIKIQPCNPYYQGYGDKDGFTIFVLDKDDKDEESVHLKFYINELKFQKIKNLIEKHLIKNIRYSISPASRDPKLKIDGLYLKSEYIYRYKRLCCK